MPNQPLPQQTPRQKADKPTETMALPWRLSSVLSALFIGYAIFPLIIVSLLELLTPTLMGSHRFFIAQFSPIVAWIVIFTGFHYYYRVDMTDFLGFSARKPIPYYLGQALLCLAGVAGILLVFSAIINISGQPVQNPYQELDKQQLSTIGLFAICSAPFMEEAVFRGLVQGTLMRFYRVNATWKLGSSFSSWMAITMSAILFALFHPVYASSWLAVGYIFSLAVLLGYFRHRTGSLWPGILAHLANNIAAQFGH